MAVPWGCGVVVVVLLAFCAVPSFCMETFDPPAIPKKTLCPAELRNYDVDRLSDAVPLGSFEVFTNSVAKKGARLFRLCLTIITCEKSKTMESFQFFSMSPVAKQLPGGYCVPENDGKTVIERVIPISMQKGNLLYAEPLYETAPSTFTFLPDQYPELCEIPVARLHSDTSQTPARLRMYLDTAPFEDFGLHVLVQEGVEKTDPMEYKPVLEFTRPVLQLSPTLLHLRQISDDFPFPGERDFRFEPPEIGAYSLLAGHDWLSTDKENKPVVLQMTADEFRRVDQCLAHVRAVKTMQTDSQELRIPVEGLRVASSYKLLNRFKVLDLDDSDDEYVYMFVSLKAKKRFAQVVDWVGSCHRLLGLPTDDPFLQLLYGSLGFIREKDDVPCEGQQEKVECISSADPPKRVNVADVIYNTDFINLPSPNGDLKLCARGLSMSLQDFPFAKHQLSDHLKSLLQSTAITWYTSQFGYKCINSLLNGDMDTTDRLTLIRNGCGSTSFDPRPALLAITYLIVDGLRTLQTEVEQPTDGIWRTARDYEWSIIQDHADIVDKNGELSRGYLINYPQLLSTHRDTSKHYARGAGVERIWHSEAGNFDPKTTANVSPVSRYESEQEMLFIPNTFWRFTCEIAEKGRKCSAVQVSFDDAKMHDQEKIVRVTNRY